MFTVLIAEKEHIDAIQQENKLFFEPFLSSQEVAFCSWNPQGQNLADSVPGLLDAVGRRRSWRAVIVQPNNEATLQQRNPFDVVSCPEQLPQPKTQPELEESWDCWEAAWKHYYETLTKCKETQYKNALEQPLQKLSTWLCFQPEDYILSEVSEKQDVHDWAMKEIGRDEIKPSARLEFLERSQYKVELRLKEQLRRAFVKEQNLDIAHPAEVYCISPRTTPSGFFDPDSFWNVRSEGAYSAFADRNLYFDRMRFLVFDLLPRTHRNFRTDYIRFLASVLIFAANPVPRSAMQARRLYLLETETDDTPLCALVTAYDKKLALTAGVIDHEMDKIRSEIPEELTDKAAEELYCSAQEVAVTLDASCDSQQVTVEEDYGLFYDYPENEFYKWNRDLRASEKALGYIIRQQSRSLKKGVGQMHAQSIVSDMDVCRLTSLQIDDIRDFTENAEDDLVESIPFDLGDVSRCTQQMNQDAQQVRHQLKRRMTKKTASCLGLLCLILYGIGFLPFLLTNWDTTRSAAAAVQMTAAVLAVLLLVMAVTLLFLRKSLTDAVKAYNQGAKQVIQEIREAMAQCAKYLSALCSVRRGRAVLDYVMQNVDVYTRRLQIHKKHQEDIRKIRAVLAEGYADYFDVSTLRDGPAIEPYEYDFDLKTEYSYPAPFLAADSRQIEFISSGNRITVPFRYVTRIFVRLEGIYES